MPVNIGNRKLYARIAGSGPVVVLNSGGGVADFGRWDNVGAAVRTFAATVNYARAGLGRSDPPPAPPSALDMAMDLHALLEAVNADRPVVLVGSSLSGLLVQLYACLYPREVAGLVLLDPTPDQTLSEILKHPDELQKSIRESMIRNARGADAGEGLVLELEKLPESCEQVRAATEDHQRLPDLPLVVITACRKTESPLGFSAGGEFLVPSHRHICERSSRGRHVLAKNSAHNSMIMDEPELIVQAIESVVREAFG